MGQKLFFLLIDDEHITNFYNMLIGIITSDF